MAQIPSLIEIERRALCGWLGDRVGIEVFIGRLLGRLDLFVQDALIHAGANPNVFSTDGKETLVEYSKRITGILSEAKGIEYTVAQKLHAYLSLMLPSNDKAMELLIGYGHMTILEIDDLITMRARIKNDYFGKAQVK